MDEDVGEGEGLWGGGGKGEWGGESEGETKYEFGEDERFEVGGSEKMDSAEVVDEGGGSGGILGGLGLVNCFLICWHLK